MTAQTLPREQTPLSPPAWARGHVSLTDADFLAANVERARPSLVVEVGVASGFSSAVLLSAMHALSGDGWRLYSCDTVDACYFNRDYPVGEAARELLPDVSNWTLRTGIDAYQASRQLPFQAVDFTFIDACHLHPWPVLDLLALLPALRPGSWVCLHDIRLPEIRDDGGSGPQHLFRLWPGEKFSEETHANIGAIRLPDDLSQVSEWVAPVLGEAWETLPQAELLHALSVEPQAAVVLVDQEKHKLIEHPEIAAAIRDCRPLLIWGCGTAGRKALSRCEELRGHIAGAIDSGAGPNHPTGIFEGFDMIPPEDLPSWEAQRPFVIVTSSFHAEITEELTRMGFAPATDFTVARFLL
jgi:predicted O-methyltransferase YrrM